MRLSCKRKGPMRLLIPFSSLLLVGGCAGTFRYAGDPDCVAVFAADPAIVPSPR
jgi:hypothetical protein